MKKKQSLITSGIFVSMLLIATALPAVGIVNDKKYTKENLEEPTWQWAESGGGYSIDYGKDVVVDDNGNTYIIGKYHTIATFGTTTLNSYGPMDSWDIYVAKLDKNGNWLWAVGAGGTFNDEGSGIALDDDGNIYITGLFYDIAYFGNITLDAYGPQDVYIAKLDSDGNWLWAIGAGGQAGEAAYGIAVDDNGNIYITGHFMFLATFGPFPLNSAGSADVFVIKLDTDGNWLWVQRGGGSSPDYVCDIALDNNGNIYLTGDFEGSATFGTDTITSLGDVDVFIAKLDNNGNWLWARSGGSNSIERGYDIAVDNNGNSYITGPFFITITFGTTTLISQGEWDVYVLKIDTNGDWQWAVRGGDSSGEGGWGIALDNSGNPYITGVFSDSSTFGTTTLISQGIRDIFVANLDIDGNWLWAVSAGGADWDEGYAIVIDNIGSIYITGYFDASAIFGETTLISEGDYDAFIAKLSFEVENQPPEAPSIDGPRNGKPNNQYEWTFVSRDPDGDDITYYVDWGDECCGAQYYGPYPSGEEITLAHTYKFKSVFTINSKAIDENGAESDLTYFEFIVPKNKPFNLHLNLLSWLFERFPNAFKLLRYVIGLLDS